MTILRTRGTERLVAFTKLLEQMLLCVLGGGKAHRIPELKQLWRDVTAQCKPTREGSTSALRGRPSVRGFPALLYGRHHDSHIRVTWLPSHTAASGLRN